MLRYITPLLALASPFAIADWTLVASTYNPTAYADLATRQRNGNYTTMHALVDFKKVPFDGDNLPYLSLRMQVEYDCRNPRFRFIQLSSHDGHMGGGNTVYTAGEPGKWRPVTDSGIQQPLREAACNQPQEKSRK